MFKSRRRNPYSRNRYGRSPLRALIFAPLILIVVLIVLELLVRLFVGVTGYSDQLSAYSGESAIVNAYRLQFLSSEQVPFDGFSQEGRLLAQQQIGSGYELVGNNTTAFWEINEQGFRDNQPLPIEKPEGEIRIFLLGNSTPFGYWNESNQNTIAHKIEERINQRVAQQQSSPENYRPDIFPFFQPLREEALALPPKITEGKYRVINAAVPGYSSGNVLGQFALNILPYQPDAIVVLDGYTDLLLPSRHQATPVPQVDTFLTNAPKHFWVYLTKPIRKWFANTYLVKAVQYWILRPEPSVAQRTLTLRDDVNPLVSYLSEGGEELEQRIDRYFRHYVQLTRLCASFKVPLVVGVQPEITGRKDLATSERAIVSDLGQGYVQRLQEGYTQLIAANQRLETIFPNNVKSLNLYQFYDDFSEVAFSDAIHLTEPANQKLAEQLYTTITNLPKVQIVPENFNL